MNNIEISVIMSVYKESINWISQSIESILVQTYENFEFLIVDDNPEDSVLLTFLRKYEFKDQRVKIIVNEKNIGLTKSLNIALRQASGKYIARMDADDISMSNRLELQYNYMNSSPETIVLGSNFSYIGDKSVVRRKDQIRFDDKSIKAQMLFVNCIPHPSVMIRKSILDKYDIKYDEEYRHGQDYRMWEVLIPYGKFACLHDKLLKYRFSKQQITTSNKQSQNDYASTVRTRLQKKWLDGIGYSYEEKTILSDPLVIIRKIRYDNSINKSLEFQAFIQYAYLNSDTALWNVREFLLSLIHI
mgnify:CR=1 FL=1